MTYSFSVPAGSALNRTIPTEAAVTGFTLTAEFSKNSDFQTISFSKAVTGTGKTATIVLTSGETTTVGDAHYRIKGVNGPTTKYLQSGKIDYVELSSVSDGDMGEILVLATDYGVVANGTNQTANFAAWIAVLKSLSSYGAVGVLPPSSSSYVGTLVLDENYGTVIRAYGAKLSVPDGAIGVDIHGAIGGSSLGWKVEGLLVRGATTNTTGVRIVDSDRTMLRDIRIENVNTGFQVTASSASTWSEGTTIRDSFVSGCQVGIDFFVTGGGNASFDQTCVENVGINNCTVAAVRLSSNLDIVRMKLDYTCWVGSDGAALDTNADMSGVYGRIMGERYEGAVGGTSGIRPRSSASGWESCGLETYLQGSLNPLVDTTFMTTGQWVSLRQGNQMLTQAKGSVTTNHTAWQVRNYNQTYPVTAYYRSTPSLIPGGNPGFVFGSGTADPDTFVNRPTGSTYPRLESNAVLTVGAYTTAARPAASTARAGAFLWDTTIKRYVVSDTVNWVGGNGNTVKTSSYTLTSGDKECVVIYNGASLTATLPTAVAFGAGRLTIKNINAANLTVATTSGQTIDGAAPAALAQWAVLNVMSDGTNWVKV